MSDRYCYFDAAGCYVCPAVAYEPEIRPHVVYDPAEGWGAGARSIDTLSGNIRVKFEVGNAAGIVVGFSPVGSFDQDDLSTITQGFYLWEQGGVRLARVVESGTPIGIPRARNPGDVFEIRRVGATVEYLHNNHPVRTSFNDYHGETLVGAHLYMTGDTVY